LSTSYNKAIGEAIDGVRDFLILHYCASTRNDTEFWKATKEVFIPPTLKSQLDLWKSRLPNSKSINQNYHGFESYSYSVMLLGLGGYIPKNNLPALDHIDSQQALKTFKEIKERTEHLCKTLPSQYEYLKSMQVS
jgi:tryptophan halogenase